MPGVSSSYELGQGVPGYPPNFGFGAAPVKNSNFNGIRFMIAWVYRSGVRAYTGSILTRHSWRRLPCSYGRKLICIPCAACNAL